MRLHHRTLLLTFVLVPAGAIARPVHSQAPTRAHLPTEMSSDSVAWQRVLAYVVSMQAALLVNTAASLAPQPWRFALPENEPQRPLLERQLQTIFRAREPLPTDSVVYALQIGRLQVSNDTARVKVGFDMRRRCPGSTRTTGSGTVEEILVPRHPAGFWGAARSEKVLVGDSVGCLR